MTFPCETPPTGTAARLAACMSAAVPRLETDRLILRAPDLTDFDAYASIAASPRGQYLQIPDREAAWLDFCQMVAGWALRGHGLWSVTARSDGRLLGFVVLGFEPGDPEPELGFMLTSDGEGRGFAREAAIAARRYAFARLGWTTLVSFVDERNDRSRHLAERLGAQLESRIADADGITLVYRHHPEAA